MQGKPSAGTAQFPKETSGDGSFRRQESVFRRWIRADGSGDVPAEPGRYHLYVSLACPWAHRAIIVRQLKGLEDVIGMTVVDPVRDERGWRFTEGTDHGLDPVNGFDFLSEAYTATDPDFDGRVTTPTLWDAKTGTVVNNESADVIRMLNSEFDAWGNASIDLYPEAMRDEIDAVNDRVYTSLNDGVYKAGFATTQEAYDEAVARVFEGLDWMEGLLGERRYLAGDCITEADWRAWVSLVRFDVAYVMHFLCNVRRIVDYERLWAYTRELYQVPGIAATVNIDHIKRHYFMTHASINPKYIVPAGPDIDFTTPHGRGETVWG